MERPPVTAVDVGTWGADSSAQGSCSYLIQKTSYGGTWPGGMTLAAILRIH